MMNVILRPSKRADGAPQKAEDFSSVTRRLMEEHIAKAQQRHDTGERRGMLCATRFETPQENDWLDRPKEDAKGNMVENIVMNIKMKGLYELKYYPDSKTLLETHPDGSVTMYVFDFKKWQLLSSTNKLRAELLHVYHGDIFGDSKKDSRGIVHIVKHYGLEKESVLMALFYAERAVCSIRTLKSRDGQPLSDDMVSAGERLLQELDVPQSFDDRVYSEESLIRNDDMASPEGTQIKDDGIDDSPPSESEFGNEIVDRTARKNLSSICSFTL